MESLREEINAALEGVGQKYSVELSLSGGTFNTDYGKFTIQVSTVRDGEIIDQHTSDLRFFLKTLGLTEENLNQVFHISGEAYVLTGYNRKAKYRNAIVKKLSSGKKYMTTMDMVKTKLGVGI